MGKDSGNSEKPASAVGLILGDRDQIAQFVLRHKDAIRNVARRKLSGETRRVFDSEDIMATVLRRVDLLARNGAIRANSEAEMTSLIMTIATNASISKFRLIKLARSRLGEESDFFQEFVRRLNACRDDDEAHALVFQLFDALESSEDRRIYLLRLRGVGHNAIGQMLGISEEASRQRWQRIRKTLAARFQTRTNL